MSSEEDRRRAPRAPISDTLFIKSISSRQVSMMEPATCNTVNASATGLQVELDFDVLETAEIALWIQMDSGERTLVSGTIRWSRSTERNTFLVGIELDAESGPAIASWLNNIH
ncbi:MAG: PilZ domain-containing protein [Gammaproteobacteria bacterium]